VFPCATSSSRRFSTARVLNEGGVVFRVHLSLHSTSLSRCKPQSRSVSRIRFDPISLASPRNPRPPAGMTTRIAKSSFTVDAVIRFGWVDVDLIAPLATAVAHQWDFLPRRTYLDCPSAISNVDEPELSPRSSVVFEWTATSQTNIALGVL
jgi:hypothetical protein